MQEKLHDFFHFFFKKIHFKQAKTDKYMLFSPKYPTPKKSHTTSILQFSITRTYRSSTLGASGSADRALRGFRRCAAAPRPFNPLRTNRHRYAKRSPWLRAPVGSIRRGAVIRGTP
jgi:hypothetical protein